MRLIIKSPTGLLANNFSLNCEQGQRERVILTLDVSGSMETRDYKPSRIQAMKNAVIQFLQHRREIDNFDEVGVVTFSWSASVVYPLTPLKECYEQIISAVRYLNPDSSTNIVEGLKLSAELLRNAPSDPFTIDRVILISDGGHTHSGNPITISKTMKSNGIIIECIGIGAKGNPELHEEVLKQIASFWEEKLLYRWIGDSQQLEQHFIELSNKLVVSKK